MKYLILWLFNLFDAIATLYFISKGMIEANPIMAVLLNCPPLFVIVKMSVVTFGCLILYKHQYIQLARIGSNICLCVYGCLTIYHIVNYFII